MDYRLLGRTGLRVSPLCLGTMNFGMGKVGGGVQTEEDEGHRIMDRGLDLGLNFFDTADMYGVGHNERLLGRALQGRRDRAVVATKFAVIRGEDGSFLGVSGRPEYVVQACDASLKRLGIDTIDLYYQHRVDPNVPIEDTVGAMAGLVKAGKVRHLGLSEASADTVRRAAAVHPITALQSEWSLFTRELERKIVPTCRELGIGLVPFSPLGRGILTGAVTDTSTLADNDFRRSNPRFAGESFDHNLALVEEVKAVAAKHGATPGQVALAWLTAQGDDVVPIPGTKRRTYLEDNVGALDVRLDDEDLDRLGALRPAGDRSDDMGWVERSTPAKA